jgi:hypothetical protein
MPVPEVLGRYFVDTFEEAADDVFKWMGLPPAQALPGLKAWEEQFAKRGPRTNLLASIVLPSVGRTLEVQAKLDRQIGALRLVEAARAYAAEKGTLPSTLEDLALPVPPDPLGRGFELRRSGDALVIATRAQDAGEAAKGVRFEVRLRK